MYKKINNRIIEFKIGDTVKSRTLSPVYNGTYSIVKIFKNTCWLAPNGVVPILKNNKQVEEKTIYKGVPYHLLIHD